MFGFQAASLIMPTSYYSLDATESQLLMENCYQLVTEKAPPADRLFIIKAEDLHRQTGIYLGTADHILEAGVNENFRFATKFLPRPFLVNGYKLNVRLYLVAVCIGGHLRGYVHDDGKNIYTTEPYEEPTDIGELQNEERARDDAAIRRRLDRMITTGYVPESHYDDKPLSGLEFFQYAEDRNFNMTYLEQSMWTRLALSLHVSRFDRDFNLCEIDAERNHVPHEVPTCLHEAIRFQHFGCDFHIDEALTGYESRMFECNKGPDFSVHSYRDGKVKREVAADIVSFMGFTGEFEGSHEAARKHRMNLIYDSEKFNPQRAFNFLMLLKDVDSRVAKASSAEQTTTNNNHRNDDNAEL
jgi:hypothetical protein